MTTGLRDRQYLEKITSDEGGYQFVVGMHET